LPVVVVILGAAEDLAVVVAVVVAVRLLPIACCLSLRSETPDPPERTGR